MYQLAVIVRSSKYAYGKAYANVTVEKRKWIYHSAEVFLYTKHYSLCRYNFTLAKRVNKPPRADISPKEQSITLPTNEVVLDGSSEYHKANQYNFMLVDEG